MSQRDRIRMSEDEIRSFLLGNKTITICSTGPGGYPHPMPMWFAMDDDGSICMTTFRKSQKVKNVQRNPRVSLLSEDGVEYFELRGVVIYGEAEILDDIGFVKDTMARISASQVKGDPIAAEGMKAVIGSTAAKRVGLRIRPGRIVSWDHRKLGGRY